MKMTVASCYLEFESPKLMRSSQMSPCDLAKTGFLRHSFEPKTFKVFTMLGFKKEAKIDLLKHDVVGQYRQHARFLATIHRPRIKRNPPKHPPKHPYIPPMKNQLC